MGYLVKISATGNALWTKTDMDYSAVSVGDSGAPVGRVDFEGVAPSAITGQLIEIITPPPGTIALEGGGSVISSEHLTITPQPAEISFELLGAPVDKISAPAATIIFEGVEAFPSSQVSTPAGAISISGIAPSSIAAGHVTITPGPAVIDYIGIAPYAYHGTLLGHVGGKSILATPGEIGFAERFDF